jgi:rRNA-processing protein FCF1
MENKQQKVSVIVDTNFLLKQVNIRNLLPREKGVTFEEKYDIMTLTEVIKEVKDETVSVFNKVKYFVFV